MTRIIIDDVHDRFTLAYAITALQRAFAEDEAFEQETVHFPEFDIKVEAESVRRINGVLVRRLNPQADGDEDDGEDEGPPITPLVPCPNRGQHAQLVDCWMCWSDVMRGDAIEADVLTDDAWRSDILGGDS